MCGIAGIVGNVMPEVEACIGRMSNRITHRGPDDSGVRVWPITDSTQATFAHRRLSIIDTSAAGHQPMSTPDGQYTIIYNGEIYNYRTLRKELIDGGVQILTGTDTEVLLQLFATRGLGCLQSINGMFAFAIRNNDTGEITAARDRLGIKPFYYYAGANHFIFSSEIRALLASGHVPRTIDGVSIAAYLSFGAIQEPRTIIKNVLTLPPAHYIKVAASGAITALESYWQLPSEKFKGSGRDAITETRRRLEESVQSQLVADVPLGAFLSGGIDSSAIVALMSRQASQHVRAVTVGFNESDFSEHHFAKKVADKWNVAHTEIILSEVELLTSLPDAISAIDQPTIDGINTWIVSRATKQTGITVALSGLGGDELFGGYPSFQRVPRSLKYASLVSPLGRKNRERMAEMIVRVLGNSLQSQKVGAAIISNGDVLSSYANVRGLFPKKLRQALMETSLGGNEQAKPYFIPDETVDLLGKTRNNGDVFNRVSQYELSLYMANMLLRDTDALSMAHALEVRVPFLDHQLVEWVYALPGHLKTGGQNKSLLIEALGTDLPKEISARRKMGFTLPFEKWLHTALKPFVVDVLNDRQAISRTGLNASAISDVLKSFYERSRSTSWSRVWSLVILLDWCQRHDVQSLN